MELLREIDVEKYGFNTPIILHEIMVNANSLWIS